MHASTVMRHIHSLLCSLLELTNVLFIIKLKELDALEETLLRGVLGFLVLYYYLALLCLV